MFPIKYIENNLVFNHDGECFAYYELTPYNYSFLSPEEKYMVHDNFRQLIAQNRDGKIHALQIATEDSLRAVQELSLIHILLENGWYESESTQDSGFFKDLPATTKKEKITHFPKLYYRMEHGLLYIRTEITLGKYQEQLLHLEKKLETGLYCELVSKELKDSYVEYVLLYDTIANRITINEVQAEHGSLRLMKNVWWEYDKLPHMLIAGGTGGGKTYFILTIIEALLRSNAVMYILDPKNADLADLSVVMPEVWYKKDDRCV